MAAAPRRPSTSPRTPPRSPRSRRPIPDAGATQTYSIVGGADAAKFTINASTGALSFVTAPNFEAPTDAGGNNV